jgi:hypothetical protein
MDEKLRGSPIHSQQHGFQRGKSTESALSETVNYIEKQIYNKRKCVGTFLDISSAFDTIKPEYVRKTLYKHGGEENVCE